MKRHYQRPSPGYYATDPQKAYLRRLLDECFAKGVPSGTGLDRHHLERVTRTEASAAIDTMRKALGGAR
jgi:hypothetical protein